MPAVVTDQEAKVNIGANLSRLLALRGWTQQQLANATGETKMTISRLVNGKHLPNAAILARIAQALDVSSDRLVDPPPQNSRRATS